MTGTSPRSDQWRTIATAVLLMAGIQLDFFGIAIVLPPMGVELDVTSATLEWILNAQLLAFAAPVIAIGRLADLLGQRHVAIAGALLFAGSTALIGALSDPAAIITLRALQGIGSAMVAVTCLSLVSLSLDGARRAAGIGIYTGGIMAVGALGPLIAGGLSDLFSWRGLFFVNSGLALTGLACLLAFVRQPKARASGERFDWIGFVLLTSCLLVLVLGLQLVEGRGWSAPLVLACLVGSLLLLAAFYRRQKVVPSPLVDFSLFANRDFAGACLFNFLGNLPTAALIFVLTLYLQYVVGLSPQMNGFIFLAMMVPLSLLALSGGRALSVFGPRLALCCAMALMALSFVCLGFVRPESGFVLLIAGLALFGAGRGLMFGIASPVALGAVLESKSAAASSFLILSRNLAIPLGVSLAVAFFRSSENEYLAHMFKLAGQRVSADMQAEIYGLLSGSDAARAKLAELAPEIAERVHLVVDHAFAHAFREVMLLALAVSIIGILSAFLVRPGGADE